MSDMLTIAQVAELVGVERRTIDQYRQRGTIPPPDGTLGRTPWWHRATIEEWMRTRPPRGRPARSGTQCFTGRRA